MPQPLPHPFTDDAVARAFDACPPAARRTLVGLRALVFDTAAATPGVGALHESLKWGEPAYVTAETGSGSTVRLGWKKSESKSDAGTCAVYFNCQTNLIETFRTLFPREFRFQGQRAIVFAQGVVVPKDALAVCIAAALTYHRRKRLAAAGPPVRRTPPR